MGDVILDLMSSRPGYISLAKDHNPYTTLLYGNGPGAHSTRADLRHVDTSNRRLYATYFDFRTLIKHLSVKPILFSSMVFFST